MPVDVTVGVRVGVNVMVGIGVSVAVGVDDAVAVGVRLGGANCVGEGGGVWVGGPGVNDGSNVRIPAVTVGTDGPVTVGSSVAVALPRGPFPQLSAKKPRQ